MCQAATPGDALPDATTDILNEYTGLDPVSAMNFARIHPLLGAIADRFRVLGIEDLASSEGLR
jgi:hypothetical protein